MQTVAAGQQAENLLDFGDEPSTNGQLTGLAATQVLTDTPAAVNLLSGMSTNPLDDLVSIFGAPSDNRQGTTGGFGFGAGLGSSSSPLPPQAVTPLTATQGASSSLAVQQPGKQEDDLLGLF